MDLSAQGEDPYRFWRERMTRLVQAMWVGLGIQLAGDIVDARWHAANDGFEGAADQLQAHWLVWLGVTVAMAAAALAAREMRPAHNGGLDFTLANCTGYAFFAAWHFAAHWGGSDSELAHVALLLTRLAMFGGIVWATLAWRQTSRAL